MSAPKCPKSLALGHAMACTPRGHACSTSWRITRETFGEGVIIELREGVPDRSRVLRAANSRGGTVTFDGLCGDQYFRAIGNHDEVSVVRTRNLKPGQPYHSRITLTPGSGNLQC